MSDAVSTVLGGNSVSQGQAKSSTSAASTQNNALDAWKRDAESKLLNMSTSNHDILDYIITASQDKNFSEAKMQAINYLINLRAQICNMVTNTLKTLFDGARAIIANIR